MTTLQQSREYQRVASALRFVAGRWWWVHLGQRLLVWLSATVLLVVVLAASAGLINLSPAVRLGMLVAMLAAPTVGLIALVIWPLRRRLSPQQAARQIEERLGGLENRYINAVQLAGEGEGSGESRSLFDAELVRRTIDEIAKETSGVAVDRAVSTRRLMTAAGAAGLAGVVLALVVLFAGGRFAYGLKRIFYPTWRSWAGQIRIDEVRPGNKSVLAGDSLTIDLDASTSAALGRPPEVLLWVRREDAKDYAPLHMQARRPLGAGSLTGSYFFNFPAVDDGFTYFVSVADTNHRDEPCRITVRKAPQVASLSVQPAYPAYLKHEQPAEPLTDGNFESPLGSVALVTVRMNRPLVTAELAAQAAQADGTFGPAQTIQMDPQDGRLTWQGKLPIRGRQQYRLLFRDETGRAIGTLPTTNFFTASARPDGPPTVQFLRPGQDELVKPGGSIDLTFQAGDDHGLTALKLMIARVKAGSAAASGGQLETEPAQVRHAWTGDELLDAKEQPKRAVKTTYNLNLGDKWVKGDRLVYWVEAADNRDLAGLAKELGLADGGGAQTVGSARFLLTVQDPAELAANQKKLLEQLMAELNALLKEQIVVRTETVALVPHPATQPVVAQPAALPPAVNVAQPPPAVPGEPRPVVAGENPGRDGARPSDVAQPPPAVPGGPRPVVAGENPGRDGARPSDVAQPPSAVISPSPSQGEGRGEGAAQPAARASAMPAAEGGVAAVKAGQFAFADHLLRLAKGKIVPFDAEMRMFEVSLLTLAYNDSADARSLAEALASLPGVAPANPGSGVAVEPVKKLVAKQDAVIYALQALLGMIGQVERRTAEASTRPDGTDLPPDVKAKWRKLAEDLEKFIDQQKKDIAVTQGLAKKPVDDFTKEDLLKLAELAAQQDKWEKFLEKEISDFSKLAEQDFSNPALLKELIEVKDDVVMAKDALAKKAVEIAVPLEESGLEMAEALTTHIEKWLPDTPDREKWSMEEPKEQGDVPMAELPKELEDMVGELMEQEEDLFDEVEDVTSKWTDSIDKGAGWDAMDGPISNMSAQGVTGNRLPNASEISGRSGEGRTGKAGGEMVENEATGKGGRNTPTRLSGDPFQAGQVKDSSKEPPGGATGGGKVSGVSGEGLEGPVPPELGKQLQRLANKQASVRNKAEAVDARFRANNFNNFALSKSITIMWQAEDDLRNYRYQNALRKKAVLVNNLQAQQTLLRGEIQVQADRSPVLPDAPRKEIRNEDDRDLPPRYKELAKQYLQSLSEEPAGGEKK